MKRLSQRIGELHSTAKGLLEESRHIDQRVRDNLSTMVITADCTRLLQEKIERGEEPLRERPHRHD
jgi:hypothetical protein